jgi:lipid-binding SYLF domain-containing protein
MSGNAWKDYGKKGLGFGKKGFDKAWQALDKLGAPVNRLSNRVGAEAFWPTTLDKESDKAARILRSFCKDGFYDQLDAEDMAAKQKEIEQASTASGQQKQKIDRPQGKQRVLKKIPSEVIKNAKGIAIFTTMRMGLWMSGAGGSGILMARVPETGEWSPPSGILLHTAAIGFLVGVDIYDCVLIINTYEALEGFKKLRATLGGELSATAGPVGMGGILDTEVHKRQAPIWTYMKSRGVYAGVQVDGTIIVERMDENERFYGEKLSAQDILSGKVRKSPDSLRTLMQTVKAAQGDSDVDESCLPPAGEAPGDAVIVTDEDNFGIPAAADPDPYGVRALEQQGLFIREAGTHQRPAEEVFQFRPHPSSPIYNTFARQSLDSSSRNSWRASVQSMKSYASTDRATQTDTLPPNRPASDSGASSHSVRDIAGSSGSPDVHPWDTPDTLEDHDVHEAGDDADHGDCEIHDASNTALTKPEVVRAVNPALVQDTPAIPSGSNFSRPRIVTIPKRVPPALPPRNPHRERDSFSTQGSLPASPSPTRSAHPEIRESLDSFHVDETVNDVDDSTFSKIKPVASATHKESHGEPILESEEFHSTPTSPALEHPPVLKPETEAQVA